MASCSHVIPGCITDPEMAHFATAALAETTATLGRRAGSTRS
jgi:hypothetical protein